MSTKERLDNLLVARGLSNSQEQARRLIMAGEVTVNGQMMDKPGMRVSADAEILIKRTARFVSRGGEKLDAALAAFPVSVENTICADVGASTGGFTDVLLQRGAAKVYAIDVGYGELHYRLRQDKRVVVMERTNARYVESLPEEIQIASIDASFISLTILLPVVKKWLVSKAHVFSLIKPQFEAPREVVEKGGVITSAEVHANVLRQVLQAAQYDGFVVSGLIRSPLKGPAGNVEFLAWLQNDTTATSIDPEEAVRVVVGPTTP